MKIQVQTYLHHTTLFLITASNIKYDNFPFLTYSKQNAKQNKHAAQQEDEAAEQ